MPRYFFHVKRGRVTVLDHQGVELAHIEDAELEAMRRAKKILSTEPDASGHRAIVIADDWRPVMEVPF